MKQVMAPVFVAFDGTKFFEAAPCEKHEEDNFPMRFVGLTIEQVDAAFDRRDKELAKAFETAGNRIGSKRRVEDNEYLRGPKRNDNGAPEPAPSGQTISEQICEEARQAVERGEESPIKALAEGFGERFAKAREALTAAQADPPPQISANPEDRREPEDDPEHEPRFQHDEDEREAAQ